MLLFSFFSQFALFCTYIGDSSKGEEESVGVAGEATEE